MGKSSEISSLGLKSMGGLFAVVGLFSTVRASGVATGSFDGSAEGSVDTTEGWRDSAASDGLLSAGAGSADHSGRLTARSATAIRRETLLHIGLLMVYPHSGPL